MYRLNDWQISDDGLSEDDVLQNGNRLLTGNGYLGRRGVVDEALPSDMPATILSGIYDRHGDLWREPVNSPDPLYTLVSVDEKPLRAGDERTVSHEQALDFRYGIYSRSTSWNINGKKAAVKAQRYAHMEDVNLLCMRYVISSGGQCKINVRQGINREIKDLNGPHLGNFRYIEQSQLKQNDITQRIKGLSCETLEKKIPLSVFSALVNDKMQYIKEEKISNSDDGIFSCLTFDIVNDTEIELIIYGAINTEKECVKAAEEQIKKSLNEGWENLLKRHKAKWDKIWNTGDVVIEGDEYAQRCIRYSLYHLWIIAPRYTENGNGRALSIPARGLSGQTYKGAIFWDTEMFIAPYFRSVRPQMASQFIRYRIQTLEGAKKKAVEYGFRGAFFAWESQESGDDACSDFNVTDVFTGRPVRTYFRDKQIHISADIVYSIQEYVSHTGDTSILIEGGMELILEAARFFLSYLYYSPEHKRYEVLDVIGPDEYHERVNNNAFTNRVVLAVFEIARSYIEMFQKENPLFINDLIKRISFNDDLEFMKTVIDKFYLPQPDSRGIIEQFDGYFRHEDCSIETVRSRLKDPKEYWGCSGGVATPTQIIKQADVVTMLALFGGDYPAEIKKANLDYYEKRTEHGSSLSACMYALLYCETGSSDKAYPFFIKSAEIDITGKSKHFAGLVYIGGTHPAANGGAWLTAIHGFCGFSVCNGEIKIKPRLPSLWNKVKFTCLMRGEEFEITVTKDNYSICKKQ
ncbi:MAG: glycoside hydrolase family 65 protein [Treponema sp.]|jgi:trehalose/maltose hydrolase-like predicted phosphorylase|nr:glycoside hydrolase family 65 protein [Treponema sp.]